MVDFFARIFIKDYQNVKDGNVRRKYGILASLFGILSNLLISAMKLVVGLLFHLISITADAVNNLADASSSIVSLIGIRLSAKPADKDHPFGHARSEYLAGFIVAIIVAALGIVLIINSAEDIIETALGNKVAEKMSSTEALITFIILAVSIVLKLYQALFNYSVGKKIDSTVLKATAADSRNDVIATAVVLIGTIIGQYTNPTRVSIDGILGVAVGVFIGISGYKLIVSTADPLLGKAPDLDVVNAFTEKILSYEGVIGMHDLQMHSYGPNCIFATCHVEVDASVNILTSHDLIDNIERACLSDLKIFTTIHIDPIVLDDPLQNELKSEVLSLVKELSFPCSIHDFRIVKGDTHINLIFDLLVPMEEKLTDRQIKTILSDKISLLNPNYYTVITIDRDYTGRLRKN